MRYKVVIIDDEPWTRESIKSLVDWGKYDMSVVGEASDGLSGLSLVNQLMPDIIITDVKMPGLDGLELLEKLRSQNCGAKTIVISGYDDYSYIRSALKLNVTDYLLKPVKPEEINEQLAQCVRQLQMQRSLPEDYNAFAFIAADWTSEYTRLREQLFDSLKASERAMITDRIQKLCQLVEKNEEKQISIQLMISIYYDLIHLLESFIVTSGYTVEGIFSEMELSYVFNKNIELQRMLDSVAALYIKAADEIEHLIKARSRVDVKQIQEYIDANYTSSITLEQVADRFYLSKEYLSKIYKQFTGMSFSSYITDLRMKKAKELICDYKVPVKEVVELAGYMDQAHFYKTFRKYFGATPGEVLKSENKN